VRGDSPQRQIRDCQPSNRVKYTHRTDDYTKKDGTDFAELLANRHHLVVWPTHDRFPGERTDPMNWHGLLVVTLAVVLGLPAAVHGQETAEQRLQRLENETQALREELARLRAESLRPLPPVSYDTASFATEADPDLKAEYYTMDELRAEMKKLAWTKGDFQIVPYGILWGATTYESARSNVGDYTLYVFSSSDQGESAWHVDAKSTRLGLDFTGPQIAALGCAESGGKVEIDFQGNYLQENKGTVLLRHAYLEVKNEYFRLLAGQTWDVISPLLPGTLMYSVGWGGGNLGYRRAQFRAERYFHFSDDLLVTTQASINGDIVSEFGPNVVGDHASWPVVEGRLAFKLGDRGQGGRPFEFGISGHIGEQSWDFLTPPAADDVELLTWSFNVDFRYPITRRLGVQGEFFTGENLGAYLGGAVQGVNTTTRDIIRSTGGWVDVWYDWTSRLHSHVGYSIDDPINSDITTGRTYNQFYFANLSYDLTKQFLVGVEASQWKTNWAGKLPGDSFRLEFVAKYGF